MSSASGGGGAAAGQFAPPSRENLIQRNLRLKVCAYCTTPGAQLKCAECKQRTYCNEKCQKKDWKTVHRNQCKKLQQVFVPPKAGWREASALSAAAIDSASAGGSIASADEIENPCPVCLDNEDDAVVDGGKPGMCSACGQLYCGACATFEGMGQMQSLNCPTCRAPLVVSYEEDFKRTWKLVHDRSPGRHTPVAQNTLGTMYKGGHGVKQDYKEAMRWLRRAAEQGFASAQYNLGGMYDEGKGVKQDFTEAVKWYRCAAEHGHVDAQFNLGATYAKGEDVEQDVTEAVKWYQVAAEQGDEGALTNLNCMQQRNDIPTPPPGTTITTVLLTSAKTAKLNTKIGVVVEAPSPAMVRPGIAFVLLNGEDQPKMLKLMNLQLS